MCQYILYLTMIFIGLGYSLKYGRKAKRDIQKFEEAKRETD